MSRYPNRVAMAPHGLILGENEATPSRKPLKHLPDLKTAINIQTNSKTTPDQPPQRQVCYIFYSGCTCWCSCGTSGRGRGTSPRDCGRGTAGRREFLRRCLNPRSRSRLTALPPGRPRSHMRKTREMYVRACGTSTDM